MRAFAALSLVLVFLAGCREKEILHKVRWSKGDPTEALSESTKKYIDQMHQSSHVYSVGDQLIHRGELKLGRAVIRGASYQAVTSQKGEVDYFVASLPERLPEHMDNLIQRAHDRSFQLVEQLKKKRQDLKNASWISDPSVVLEWDGQVWQRVIEVEFLTAKEIEAKKLIFSEVGEILREQVIGFHAVDGVGAILQHNSASLIKQTLKELEGDGTLTGRWVRALTAKAPAPKREDHNFVYDEKEHEFDDVQAYYYADQAVRWFANELDVKLARPLEIKLHIGGDEPSNAMFYYQGQIRLGDGDGVVYKKIPRDPSIVAHEVAHAFVHRLSGLPSQGEGGSLSEAFSDLFAALHLDDPKMGAYAYMGGPFKRSLENNFRADQDLKGKLYGDSLVVSGTFWDLRKALGPEKVAELAKAFLMRVGPSGTLGDFVPVFNEIAQLILDLDDLAVARGVLERRGWHKTTLD